MLTTHRTSSHFECIFFWSQNLTSTTQFFSQIVFKSSSAKFSENLLRLPFRPLQDLCCNEFNTHAGTVLASQFSPNSNISGDDIASVTKKVLMDQNCRLILWSFLRQSCATHRVVLKWPRLRLSSNIFRLLFSLKAFTSKLKGNFLFLYSEKPVYVWEDSAKYWKTQELLCFRCASAALSDDICPAEKKWRNWDLYYAFFRQFALITSIIKRCVLCHFNLEF